MAFASRRRKLDVVLELVDQTAELGEQSGIFVQVFRPGRVRLLAYRRGLGTTSRRNEKNRRDGGRALDEKKPSFLECLRVSHPFPPSSRTLRIDCSLRFRHYNTIDGCQGITRVMARSEVVHWSSKTTENYGKLRWT